MRLTVAVTMSLLLAAPVVASAEPTAALAHRAEGDRLRAEGHHPEALAAYQAALTAGGDSAETWKRIGWSFRSMHRTPAAIESLETALRLDPADREARDDLESLRRRDGLAARAWLGGTEPGTSKQAFEGRLRYAGFDRLELQAGAGWSDNIFYESTKGYATAYLFYAAGSYVKGDLSLRRYAYSGANRPTPDSSAYDLVPRVELEVSHRFGQVVRTGLAYQLFAPNFFYDTQTRILNHKVTGEVALELGLGFSVSGTGALLIDPDPARTSVKGRPVPGAPPGTTCTPGVAAPDCASATTVVTRRELLLGGGVAWSGERVSASLRVIPNRDLDASYAWSLLAGLQVRPLERLALDLQWILDRYATASGPTFAGKDGHIVWLHAGYQAAPALLVGGGFKYVANPSPASTSPTAGARSGATLLLDVEWRTGLLL